MYYIRNNRNSKTTIALTRTTRNKLAKLGSKDNTFEQIISKLIEFFEDVKINQKVGSGGQK